MSQEFYPGITPIDIVKLVKRAGFTHLCITPTTQALDNHFGLAYSKDQFRQATAEQIILITAHTAQQQFRYTETQQLVNYFIQMATALGHFVALPMAEFPKATSRRFQVFEILQAREEQYISLFEIPKMYGAYVQLTEKLIAS